MNRLLIFPKRCPKCKAKRMYAGECLNCGYKDMDRIQKMEKLRKELSKDMKKRLKNLKPESRQKELMQFI